MSEQVTHLRGISIIPFIFLKSNLPLRLLPPRAAEFKKSTTMGA
jgi:hypothetical protein